MTLGENTGVSMETLRQPVPSEARRKKLLQVNVYATEMSVKYGLVGFCTIL
jgi:hypothetical protein